MVDIKEAFNLFSTMIEKDVPVSPMVPRDQTQPEPKLFRAGAIWQSDSSLFHRYYEASAGTVREAVWSPEHKVWLDYPD